MKVPKFIPFSPEKGLQRATLLSRVHVFDHHMQANNPPE